MTFRREDLADGIVLYNADCRDVLPTLSGIDCVITDPPYGIGFASQPTRYQRINGLAPKTWDNERPDLSAALAAAGKVVIWGGNYFSLPPSRGWLVWTKTGNAPSMADLELAWTSVDMNSRRFEKSVKSASLEKNLQEAAHPTQKPVELMVWSIEQMPAPAETICDLFAGSGTTGVACVRLGRRFIGIEIEPKYFDIACRRISDELRRPRLALDVPPKPTQEALGI